MVRSTPSADPPQNPDYGRQVVETWSLLVRYHRATVAAMDQSLRDNCGYSLDHYDVLHQISIHDGPIRMGELAQRLVVANSSCNRIVGRLVEEGLIDRRHGEIDRREIFVSLTPKGRRVRLRLAVIHTRDIERLFGKKLSAEAFDALDGAMRLLLAEDATFSG